MATEKRIPEDLRRRLGDALQRSVPESLSPTQLSALTNELGERGFKDLQRELYTAVVGAVASEEYAKQAEATERVNQIKGGLTSERDEQGRRHPSRSKHFMLIGTAVLALVGFLIWNSFRQPVPPRPSRTQPVTAPTPPASVAEVEPAPQVALGTEQASDPREETEAQPTPEAPPEPTVPAPRFGGDGAFTDTGDDFYAYGSGGGYPSGAYGEAGPGQGPGLAADTPPLSGGGGGRLALSGGGGGEPQPLTGGLAAGARLNGGTAQASPLVGGAAGGADGLTGGAQATADALAGGATMAPAGDERIASPALAATQTAAPSIPRAPASVGSGRLSAPRLPATPNRTASRTTGSAQKEIAPGALLEGKIEAAPVLATGLPEAPVSVRDASGRVWLGVAKLAGASGRAMITLDEIVIGNRLYRTKASVLSPDRVYGVEVQAKEVAPAIASSTLRAALGGVAEYVKGLQDATTVYVDASGNRVEERQPPRVEWVVAKRLAEVFDLPIEEKAVSRIFVIESGKPVRILVRQAPIPADDAR